MSESEGGFEMRAEAVVRGKGSAVNAPARARTTFTRLAAVVVLAAAVSALAASGASAAPKPIVFSGTLKGISVDVGQSATTGATFHTTNGTFTAAEGLESGTYSSSFTLGAVSFPIPIIREFEVTGTFTLRTNGGTFTAAVISATSSVFHGTIPGEVLTRRFSLELDVVAGTGRFKRMTGTLQIDTVARGCGWPPVAPAQPPCPDVPFGSDPILDWTHEGTISGALVRTTGPPPR